MTIQKGSALITAVMITMMLTIMLSGIVFATGDNTRTVFKEIERSRLYYAAEGGSNYMLSWLKSINYRKVDEYDQAIDRCLSFNNSSDYPRYFPSTDYPKEIAGGIKIKHITLVNEFIPHAGHLGTNKAVWTLQAIAESRNGARACTVSVSNVKAKSVASYASHYAKSIPGGYYITGYRWWGDAYFGEEIRFFDKPTFRNNVETASKVISKNSNSQTVTDNYANLFEYSKGLDDGTWGLNENTNQTEARLKEIFQQRYEHSVPQQNPEYTFLGWDNVTNPTTAASMGINTVILDDLPVAGGLRLRDKRVAGSKLHIQYEADGSETYLTVNADGTKLIDKHALGNRNVVAVDSGWAAVGVEGIINKNVTLITHSSDIEIHNDIVHKKMLDVTCTYLNVVNQLPSHFWDRTDGQADWNAANGNPNFQTWGDLLISKMQYWYHVPEGNSNRTLERIGLIAGAKSTDAKPNDIIIKRNKKTGGVATDGQNEYNVSALVITAAMLSPYGQIRAEEPEKWAYKVNCVIFGSMMGKLEGYTSTTDKGIFLKYANDFSFNRDGLYPPGFRPLSSTNSQTNAPQLEFAATSKWRIGWK